MDGRCCGRARRDPGSRSRRGRLGCSRQDAGDAAQGGSGHRYRRPERQGLQRPRLQRAQGRAAAVRRPGPRVHLEERGGLRPEPRNGSVPGQRSRDRGRLPHGRRDRRCRQEVPEDEVRDHRRPGGRAEGQAEERARHHVRAQEAGCLAGVAAATESKSGTISSVGGLKIPSVDAFIAGYQYCGKKVKPGLKTINAYSQDFAAQDKCKEIALNQIGQGSDVIFQVAGGCGLGALTAAKDSKAWGIGVDNDQSFLGTHILTSAQKKVDAGVTQTIKLTIDGKYKGGVDGVFNVKSGGVGYGKISTAVPNRSALIAKLNSWAKQISTGKVKPPSTVSG